MKTTIQRLCLATSVLFAASAGAAFKCVDDRGLTHVGDTPPDQCANVVIYEVTRSGRVIRKIDPSLTTEQVRAKTEAEVRRKEAERASHEQQRKDLALLATYSKDTEFDLVRDRNIDPIRARIASAQERIEAIEKRVTELEGEMEFYKAGKSTKSAARNPKSPGKSIDAPPMLVSELQRLQNEKQGLDRSVARYEREIVEVRNRVDADKKRWLALKAGGGVVRPPEPAVADAKADAKAGARAETKPAPKPNAKTY